LLEGSGMPMPPSPVPHPVTLEFSKRLIRRTRGELHRNLSSVESSGEHLWLASDETVSIERLTRDGDAYVDHVSFSLTELLELPTGEEEEIDIEGLSWQPPYLWIAGSHALKRAQPRGKDPRKDVERLGEMVRETNRYLLARVPLVKDGRTGTLVPVRGGKGTSLNGERVSAARLFGTGRTNLLIDAIRDDRHLDRFLSIPSKENGFDIEGLAAVGDRLLIGLRGPVVGGWAVVLEIEPVPLAAHLMALKPIGPDGELYRKHFLHLGGLGIRELALDGDALLVLAGPTMDLDGDVILYRWRGFGKRKKGAVVPQDDLERVLDVRRPAGAPEGHDHAEGMALVDGPDGTTSVLIVYDAPARRHEGGPRVRADLFPLR
jgi:hypothetical protein